MIDREHRRRALRPRLQTRLRPPGPNRPPLARFEDLRDEDSGVGPLAHPIPDCALVRSVLGSAELGSPAPHTLGHVVLRAGRAGRSARALQQPRKASQLGGWGTRFPSRISEQ